MIFGLGGGGELQDALAPNRVGGSGGILPLKILNFTLPEMQSNGICYFEGFKGPDFEGPDADDVK